jgi:hypothetical protein
MCFLRKKESANKAEKNCARERKKSSPWSFLHLSSIFILAAVRAHRKTIETCEQCCFHHHGLYAYHHLLLIHNMIQPQVTHHHLIHDGHDHQPNLGMLVELLIQLLVDAISTKMNHFQTFYIISIPDHNNSNQLIQ